MVFWTGIIIGAIFALFAIKIGFYEILVMLFNIVISIYLAVFLRPTLLDVFPKTADMLYGKGLIVLATGTAAFLILHGLSYALFTGQISISFPKIFDIPGACFLGFLTGLLVWNFVILLVYITPISQQPIVKAIGFDSQPQQTNVPVVRWWCNLVNTVVSSHDNKVTAEQAIRGAVLESVEEKAPEKTGKPSEPAEPNDTKTSITEENPAGSPPEADAEDI